VSTGRRPCSLSPAARLYRPHDMKGDTSFIEGPRGQPLLRSVADTTSLLERCFNEHARAALLYAENLPPGFFDLSSGVAGDVLQKLRTYGIRLAVVSSADVQLSRRFPLLIEEEHRKPYFRLLPDREQARAWLEGPDPREALREKIRRAFANTPRPDNSRLRDSNEGEEPYLVEKEFSDKQDWRTLDAAFLDRAPDGFASALSFFSREALRYFLPAYMLADIDDKLDYTQVPFRLWHGFDDESADKEINPRRYGGLTWFDEMTHHFALFTRDEAEAIVAYLEFKAPQNEFEQPMIKQALANYWYPRLRRP
jgi:hypothetical protein